MENLPKPPNLEMFKDNNSNNLNLPETLTGTTSQSNLTSDLTSNIENIGKTVTSNIKDPIGSIKETLNS